MDLFDRLDKLGFCVSKKEVNITSKTGLNNTHPIIKSCKSVISLEVY